jgi:hypothetical protein
MGHKISINPQSPHAREIEEAARAAGFDMTPSPRELKACPFCGTVDHLAVSKCGSLTGDMPDRPYRVVCNHIDHDQVQGPVAYGRFAAIAAWNTRPTPDLGDVDEMVEELRELKKGWVTSKSFSKFIDRIADTIIALRAALDKNA